MQLAYWIRNTWQASTERLARHGIIITNPMPIGEGSNGQVFQAKHVSGWPVVVKFTLDQCEVKAVNTIISLPYCIDGFPRYQLAPFKISDYFVIVREPVSVQSSHDKLGLYKQDIFDALNDLSSKFTFTRGRGRAKYFREYIQSAEALEVYYPLIGAAVKQVANEKRILLSDFKLDNIGMTIDNREVFFDCQA